MAKFARRTRRSSAMAAQKAWERKHDRLWRELGMTRAQAIRCQLDITSVLLDSGLPDDEVAEKSGAKNDTLPQSDLIDLWKEVNGLCPPS